VPIFKSDLDPTVVRTTDLSHSEQTFTH